MTGVQLIGKEQVVSTYETLDAHSWALYQGKQFIVGGSGVNDLDMWLTNFSKAGSTATYMLRAYQSNEVPTCAAGNADYIACISFKVCDPYDGMGIHGQNAKLTERIGALEEQLKSKDEPESDDIGDIVIGWLSDPVKLNQVAGAFRQIFGGSGYTLEAQPVLQAISGVEPAQSVPGPTETELDELEKALDRLEKKDKKLTRHLSKLADLSEKNPALFQTVLTQLDAL